MIGNRCLLDTSIIIHAFKKNNNVVDRLESIAEIYVPTIVEGELFYGAYRSADPAKHISLIRSFMLNCRSVVPDRTTAEIYGAVKATLVKKGRPIPENDIWIAAISQQYNMPLYTTDKHFQEIDGISILK
ncbi:type II toxin-antitoxin system VapC family toxin [Nemorincola caseinilytica]|uniref:type II toxin-antitoxin system VapC family toxin n=1 Tax=Nemorincola caseinilytica TaxID=2054315 RepID=UPI003CD05684